MCSVIYAAKSSREEAGCNVSLLQVSLGKGLIMPCRLFIKIKGKPDSTKLLVCMHQLYNSLLQLKKQVSPDKLASLAEIVISIAVIRSNNHWCTAVYVAQLCCHICFAYHPVQSVLEESVPGVEHVAQE